MKNLYFILILLPSCIFAQDDNLYLHCQYDAPWSQISLDGNRERALQGEVWQIAEALGLWRGFNLYTDDSFPAQSYTAIELLRDLNLLDSQPSTLDFKINMGLERIDLYVGSEVFIEIDRMSGRFLYKNKSETPEADIEDVSLIDDVSSPVVEGDCQKISKEEVRTILTEQSQRYEGVIETIEETRKF